MKYELLNKSFNSNLNDEMHVLIGADFVPTESNKYLFEKGDITTLFGSELAELFSKSDLNVFNLEVPITGSNSKLPKAGGPNLRTYPEIINILKEIRPVLLSGANNHIYDYQQKGIEDTLACLEESGISHVGFGRNINEARRPYIVDIKGKKIGIYACSENEFCCAHVESGGSNGYDPLETFDDIRRTKEKCEYLIVLHHGGRENYRYPSPQLKRVCHKMADSGADLIICQHSHCVGAYEIQKDSVIVYGQGNVLFDYNHVEEWQTSILIELTISYKKISVNAIPIEKNSERVNLASEFGEGIISGFKERSNKLNNPDFIAEQWNDFCTSQQNILLLRGIMGINSKLLLAMNKITHGGLIRLFFGKKHKLLLMNYIRCESIREAVLDVLDEEKYS